MVKTFDMERRLKTPIRAVYWAHSDIAKVVIVAQNIRALLWEGMTHG